MMRMTVIEKTTTGTKQLCILQLNEAPNISNFFQYFISLYQIDGFYILETLALNVLTN